MKYLYNSIYLLLLIVAIPWVLWRVCVQRKNRRGWMQKLFGVVPHRSDCDLDHHCVWIHAVSVGEVNLLPPFVKRLESRHPGIRVCISTTTETGFDLANKIFADKQIFFCPADFSWAINNVIHRLRPNLLILTELELWPNLIRTAKQNSLPIALINGRISEKSFTGYRRIGFLTRPMFASLDMAAVQTEEYRDRLLELGTPADNIHVTGNIKFDNCETTLSDDQVAILNKAKITKDDFVIVAGSTQENEDLMAIEIYQQLKPMHNQLKLVLVPRHPERSHRIVKVLAERKLPFVRRSEMSERPKTGRTEAIMLVDVIGELKAWWSVANVAYVGGSMGSRGGQNMIEPAAFGVPICFGPRTANFKDVVELLLSHDAARVVNNESDLKDFILFTLNDPQAAHQMGQRASQLTMTQKGAVGTAARLVEPLLLSSIDIKASGSGKTAA